MTATEIIKKLQGYKRLMREEYGVETLALFGSYATGESKPESDVDFLVKLSKPKLHYWVQLKAFLEGQLGHPVDLITDGKHLSQRFRNRVSKSMIHV